MTRILTLDIEAKERVDFDRPWDAGMSVCCTWDSWSAGRWGRFSFFQDDTEDLDRLFELLEAADLIITYNGDRYDLPVLQHLFGGKTPQVEHCDLMLHIERELNYRLSLEKVARATLGRGKTGHGLGALECWRNGYWARLCTYCMNDVLLTRDLFLYGQMFGFVWRLDDSERRQPIPLALPGGVEFIRPVRGEKYHSR